MCFSILALVLDNLRTLLLAFAERIEETGSLIIIVCAEMTATARDVARVREMLAAEGEGDVIMLVAGGPFAADADLAKSVGANGVVRSAESAIRIINRVAKARCRPGFVRSTPIVGRPASRTCLPAISIC